jgi:hypothetical protein
MGLDVWALPAVSRQIEQDQRDSDRITEGESAAQRRSALREQIVDEVRGDRMGLIEAAARFRDLNAAAGPACPELDQHFAGDSSDERCCRQVIAWVRASLLPQSPEEAARLTGVLEAELQYHQRREGGIRLPR